jgi:hypothetical protein
MKLQDVIQKVENQKKGSFMAIQWQTEVGNARAKKDGVTIIKKTQTVVRCRVNYKNTQRYLESKSESEPSETTRAPWNKELDSDRKWIRQNLKDSSKLYLSVIPVKSKIVTKTNYYVNNVQVTKQELLDAQWVAPSSVDSKDLPVVMTVGLDNIIKIGK